MDSTIVEPVTFALMPSISLDAILMRRDALHASIRELHATYLEMHARRRALFDGDRSGDATDYSIGVEWIRTRREIDDEDGIQQAFKRVDADAWGYLLGKSGLEQMMDAKQRADWRKQLDDLEMPEFTRANIDATFNALAGQREEIFERGVVNVFRQLSHDYKTNTPVKLGKRLVCTYATERNTWTHDQKHATNAGKKYVTVYGPSHGFADKLDDLVRAFCVLEGKIAPGHEQGAYAMLSRGGWMKGDHEIGETPEMRDVEFHGYVKFRGFKNGNAHLTFLRPDLVDKLNKIIAKHFPNALPPNYTAPEGDS